MKKLIIAVLAAVTVVSTVSAQPYYKNTPLTESTEKFIILSTIADTLVLTPSQGFTLMNSAKDYDGAACTYRIDPSWNIKDAIATVKAKAKAESKSIAIMPCYITPKGRELLADGYISVKLKVLSDSTILKAEAERLELDIIEHDPYLPLWYSLHIRFTEGQNPVDKANKLEETGKFNIVYASFSFNALSFSYDPDVSKQWGLYNRDHDNYDISVAQAWDYATGYGIKIAIVDTGVQRDHVDLADNMYPESYDTESGTSPSTFYGSHGTHCAGIAAAVRNNGLLMAGVAPDAQIISVSSSLNTASTNLAEKLARGIIWAFENDADVISCSWHCDYKTPEEKKKGQRILDAIDHVTFNGRDGKGCVIVFAAGNKDRKDDPHDIKFPAGYSTDVIAVTNMSRNGDLSESSCYGESAFVAAPGEDILSTVVGGYLEANSGTSMACPHVAGVAALILERNPNLTAQEVKGIIARSAKKVGTEPYTKLKQYGTWNEKYGYGLVDAYKAVLNTPVDGLAGKIAVR